MKQRQREWELADAAKNNAQNPNVVRNLTEILQGDASMLLIENFTNLTQEEKQNYEDAYEEFSKDEEVIYTYNLVFNLSLALITVGLLIGVAVVEFVIPLCLKNGQTVGKKIFGLCLVKNDSVKINNMMLFIRAFLGKFTIETMIPVYFIVLLYFGHINLLHIVILGVLAIAEILLLIIHRKNHIKAFELQFFPYYICSLFHI